MVRFHDKEGTQLQRSDFSHDVSRRRVHDRRVQPERRDRGRRLVQPIPHLHAQPARRLVAGGAPSPRNLPQSPAISRDLLLTLNQHDGSRQWRNLAQSPAISRNLPRSRSRSTSARSRAISDPRNLPAISRDHLLTLNQHDGSWQVARRRSAGTAFFTDIPQLPLWCDHRSPPPPCFGMRPPPPPPLPQDAGAKYIENMYTVTALHKKSRRASPSAMSGKVVICFDEHPARAVQKSPLTYVSTSTVIVKTLRVRRRARRAQVTRRVRGEQDQRQEDRFLIASCVGMSTADGRPREVQGEWRAGLGHREVPLNDPQARPPPLRLRLRRSIRAARRSLFDMLHFLLDLPDPRLPQCRPLPRADLALPQV